MVFIEITALEAVFPRKVSFLEQGVNANRREIAKKRHDANAGQSPCRRG
jgi:hypothetical protein